ncbi:MAG: cupin domain-containing protein [Candidatus Woesebacteria bacterium]|jgi:mannose-6-phosphate isomerase-like protein (cupin superfamily)
MDTTDHGPAPYVTNIEQATIQNNNYRATIWTGKNLQLTVMSIAPGHDIGLEVHNDNDQFLRIEQGQAKVKMGPSQDDLTSQPAKSEDAIFVPAGTWHNVINTGQEDLKVYSVYGPAHHPHGTIHPTKEDAEEAEANE